MTPLLLDQAAAAKELGTSRDVVRALIGEGELRIVELPGGKAWRIPYSELVAWVERNAKVKSEWLSASGGDTTESAQEDLPHGRSQSPSTGSVSVRRSTGANPSNTQRLWEKSYKRKSRRDSSPTDPDNVVALPSSS